MPSGGSGSGHNHLRLFVAADQPRRNSSPKIEFLEFSVANIDGPIDTSIVVRVGNIERPLLLLVRPPWLHHGTYHKTLDPSSEYYMIQDCSENLKQTVRLESIDCHILKNRSPAAATLQFTFFKRYIANFRTLRRV
jgi:hypothetical protein